MALQLSKISQFVKKASAWSAMRNSYTKFWAEKDSMDKYDSEDEARRLQKEIKLAIEQVEESQFYAKMREQIANDEFQNQLKSVLGSHSQLNMVIYALGSLVYSYCTHRQLALALLLQRDCSWINQVEVYYPDFAPADVIVLKELGCHVLKFNERGRRKVEEPTLFYMPYPEHHLVGNLLEINWSPCRIKKLIILMDRMKETSEFDEHTSAIQNYTKEMVLQNLGEEFGYSLYNFAWHFFEVNSQINMDTLCEGKFSKKSRLKRRRCENDNLDKEPHEDIIAKEKSAEEDFMIPFVKEYESEEEEEEEDKNWPFLASCRGPRKYRCHSNAPPKDWIKLNISGIGSHGNTPAGYGGICHDEFMNPILSYNGFLDDDVDETTACLEALKRGLTNLLEKNKYNNLIVEGDNLKFIHQVNKRHNSINEETDESLEELFDLLSNFLKCVVYHIYEEANLKAYELARNGAMSSRKEGLLP